MILQSINNILSILRRNELRSVLILLIIVHTNMYVTRLSKSYVRQAMVLYHRLIFYRNRRYSGKTQMTISIIPHIRDWKAQYQFSQLVLFIQFIFSFTYKKLYLNIFKNSIFERIFWVKSMMMWESCCLVNDQHEILGVSSFKLGSVHDSLVMKACVFAFKKKGTHHLI